MKSIYNKNVILVLYTTALFLALILPGYADLIEAIISMSRNTIHFSSLDIASILNTKFTLHLAQYFVISIISTVAFIYLTTKSTKTISDYFKEKLNPLIAFVSLPAFSILGLIQLNSYLFPYSSHFYYDLAALSPTSVISIILIGTFILNLLLTLVLLIFKALKSNYSHSLITITICFIIFFISTIYTSSASPKLAPPDTKNVIIIGIDSFRMDHTHNNMPFLDGLLNKSNNFINSYTPFARTYPAWSTILSGQYPPTSGARYNLINENLQQPTNNYLPNILKRNGYKTIYASDERRFSQIGKQHGFDKVVGPRAGLGNFIIGQYADYPITNLLTLFEETAFLLPELTLNRAASHIYNPMAFTNILNNELSIVSNSQQPVFLAVHYCMPHWPFHHGRKLDNSIKEDLAEVGYHQALNSVDKQIQSLWESLESSNLLDNSIVVFLSDHGESWSEELNFDNNLDPAIMFHTNGHGANVISENEHKVMFSIYEQHLTQPVNIERTTTLADVTPTILGQLNIQLPTVKFDGENAYSTTKNDKIFPVESGFTIRAIAQSNINVEQAVTQAASRYEIQENGTLRIKINEIPFLNQGKRVAVRNKSLLLTYQNIDNESFKRMLALNLENLTATELTPNDGQHLDLLTDYCFWYADYLEKSGFCPTKLSVSN